jgi:predicted nucleic acid-binding protein
MPTDLAVVLDTNVWISGGAQYIVSGDKDLQALGTYQQVKILSLREFVELIQL